MALQFKKAVKSQAKARIGLIGPAGSGKTYTALLLAQELGEKVAVVDTEHGSASKYAHRFSFDTLELDSFSPAMYTEAIQVARAGGYDVLVIDSLTHAWTGADGALEQVDKNSVRYSGNKFAAWRDVTPLHNGMVEAILAAPMHVIATLRSKMEYIQTQDDKGRTVIKKVGMAPIQRDGMEYEFDVVGDLDIDHNLIVTKTRCEALDGTVVNKPGKQVADVVKAWLTDGAEVPVLPKAAPVQAPAPKPAPSPVNVRQMPAAERGDATQWGGRLPTAEELAPQKEATVDGDGPKPTEKQLKRLFAIAYAAGVSNEGVKALIIGEFNKDSTKALTLDEYEKACDYLELMGQEKKQVAAQ